MKNSLSEIKDLPIAVGNILITGLVSETRLIYKGTDQRTKTLIYVQPPKGANLRVGKIYGVLGRLANLSLNNKNNLMVYVYTLTKSRIEHTADFTVYIPASDYPLSEKLQSRISPKNPITFSARHYCKLLLSIKESETIDFLVDCDNPINQDGYLEFTYGPDKLKSANGYSTLNLTHTGKQVTYESLNWICKKFNIELN